MRRVILAIFGILLAGAACTAQQAIPLNKPPAQPSGAGAVPPVYVVPPRPTGAAMDLIAVKVAAEIAAQNMKGVVVVGLYGPDRRITELGTRLRGMLSDSLRREAAGVKVPDGNEIRDFLGANRIGEDMVYSNALGEWIAKRMRMDGYVTARINLVDSNTPVVLAELFICTTGVCKDIATLRATLELTPEELEDAGRDYVPELKVPVMPPGTDGMWQPKCLVCPMPTVPPELRIENIQGSSHLLVTVLSDGTVDDLFVVAPMGHGLDTLAADAVLTWKFSPAHDANDVPVTMQTEVEIPFKIEGVPVKVVKKK